MPAVEFAIIAPLRAAALPSLPDRRGFLLSHFGRIPDVGDKIEVEGWRFEVLDLDGRRIDKVLASRTGAA
jgi:putative hemolysin